MSAERTLGLLMAEDDVEDQMLLREALRVAQVAHRLDVVADGEGLLEYLQHCHQHRRDGVPDLILLDLNMPKVDGREALSAIKSHPEWRRIPVVVLTTSGTEEDIARSYDLGVNSYIRKPATFAELVEIVSTLGQYWSGVVELPRTRRAP